MNTLTEFTHHRIRHALRDWMAGENFTHALTLNTDRDITETRLKSIFSTFCVNVDRQKFGRQRVSNTPCADRLHAIAFPEHLNSNPHLHAVADLQFLLDRNTDHTGINRIIRNCWLSATRGVGSVDVQPLNGTGWQRYITKDAWDTDPRYYLSSDFHPA